MLLLLDYKNRRTSKLWGKKQWYRLAQPSLIGILYRLKKGQLGTENTFNQLTDFIMPEVVGTWREEEYSPLVGGILDPYRCEGTEPQMAPGYSSFTLGGTAVE